MNPSIAPFVSVVIPAYNVAAFIKEAVGSVLSQSMAELECVVVDDGSTDDTYDVVSRISDGRLRVIRKPNGGVSSARNAGFRAARSAFILFLDGDDILHPTAIERLYKAMMVHADAVLMFGTSVRLLPSGALELGQKPVEQHKYSSGSILAEMIVRKQVFGNCGQALIRKDVIEEVGGFDPSLTLSEDWEFFCRVAARGPCIYIGPQDEILRHRVRSDSAAPTLSTSWENHLPAVRKVNENPDLIRIVGAHRWNALIKEIEAVHMFEAGRQNFTNRNYAPAMRLMLGSLVKRPSIRRVAIFGAAIISIVCGRPLLPRLRPLRPEASLSQ